LRLSRLRPNLSPLRDSRDLRLVVGGNVVSKDGEDLATGEILSLHLIEPDKSDWRNQMREPGRWPSSQE
jgi:hypothetical protein